MKAKEVNKRIEELSKSFFTEQGYKFSKKNQAYYRSINGNKIEYSFTYITRSPKLYYEIILYISIDLVEEIVAQIDGTGIIGMTYIFPMAYFIDPTNYINKNRKYEIAKDEDIEVFVQAYIANYIEYVLEFVERITQPEQMLELLHQEINTGKSYAHSISTLLRCLVLMKLLNKGDFKDKLVEFKSYLKDYDEALKKEYFGYMDEIDKGDLKKIIERNKNLSEEITVDYHYEDNMPTIDIVEEGLSYLLINEWPIEENNPFTDEEVLHIEQILTDITGVKVEQEDRERFAIMSSDMEILLKIKTYFENKMK